MNNDSEEENMEFTPVKIFGVIIPFIPKLMFRCAGSFLRFKRQAKKGGKAFKKELLNQGLDKKTATSLTEEYLKSSNITKIFKKMQ